MDELDPEIVAPQPQEAQDKDPRDSTDFWREFIKSAKKAAEPHWNQCRAGWNEFKKKRPSHALDEQNKSGEPWAPFPIYWSSCKTIEPAFYSRQPKITVEREFGIEDDLSLTMSLIAERMAGKLVKCSDFDAVMRHGVGQYLHCDKAAPQLMYDRKIEQVPTGEVDQMGQPVTKPQAVEQKIYLAPLNYDEVLHTPNAKTEMQITEKAYYFRLTRDQAKTKFSPEVYEKIEFKKYEERQENKKDDGAACLEQPGEYVEGWECYSKPNRKVYFLSEQYADGFLKIVPDEEGFGLREFFPSTPFQISSPNDTDLYPTTAYSQCEELLRQAHACAYRFGKLYKSVRRRALVDGTSPEVLAAFEELGDNEFIVIENLQALVEKGGIENLIHYLPVQELVAAIGELAQIKQQLKDEFYEWFGVPDILRGASDPVETAAAQEVKAASAHDRFKFCKSQIATMARDAIEMMVDLALKVYDDNKIARMVGFDYMTPEHQQRFPDALLRLRNDEERLIRIGIDTDTLSFLDQQLRQQQTEKATNMVTAGLQAIGQVAEQGPDFVSVGLQTILMSLENIPTGKEFNDGVKKAVNSLIEKISQPPPEQPPPPDYEQMKIDVASARAQTENFKAQADLNLQMREQDRKDYETQLKERDSAFEQQIQSVATQLDQRIQQFVEFIESQRLQIDQMKVQLDEREKFMEEQRLMADTQIEALRIERESPAKEQATAQLQPPMIIQPPPMAPINLQFTIDASKKGATVTSINHDEFGNATMTTLPIPEGM